MLPEPPLSPAPPAGGSQDVWSQRGLSQGSAPRPSGTWRQLHPTSPWSWVLHNSGAPPSAWGAPCPGLRVHFLCGRSPAPLPAGSQALELAPGKSRTTAQLPPAPKESAAGLPGSLQHRGLVGCCQTGWGAALSGPPGPRPVGLGGLRPRLLPPRPPPLALSPASHEACEETDLPAATPAPTAAAEAPAPVPRGR